MNRPPALIQALSLMLALAVAPWSHGATAIDGVMAIEAGVEHFRWQEYNDDDQRLLTEHGPRFIVGASYDNLSHPASGPLYALRIDGYLASVDYDGQDTTRRFVATTTHYRGWSGEFDLGWRSYGLGNGSVAFDLVAGIGYEQWRRDISGSVNALGVQVSGLVEDYSVLYGRAGIGIEHAPGGGRGYLSVGARYPFSVDEDVVLRGDPLSLSPGERWAAFLSYQISLDALTGPGHLDPHVRFHYESWRFARSNTVRSGDLLVWQPKSHLDVFGVMFGVSF